MMVQLQMTNLMSRSVGNWRAFTGLLNLSGAIMVCSERQARNSDEAFFRLMGIQKDPADISLWPHLGGPDPHGGGPSCSQKDTIDEFAKRYDSNRLEEARGTDVTQHACQIFVDQRCHFVESGSWLVTPCRGSLYLSDRQT